MTIDEAIEIKGRTGEEFLNTDPDKIEEADRLSVEALKRVLSSRVEPRYSSVDPLPGETPD